ncbi:Bromodomain containing protein [Trichomonas vaginalis G3]|uniref:Bromodomain containing protein n=1 Tax=Trichomonas vaginalis (strain ATCC PRA-98 / G3) TaxID=412133 RepID=A2FDR5_TRIV3|nr:acetylation-dependent protein binding [Trichomonas vaginalis G3]EAX96965.1 Bromodomain containing protein [Trichomonas vaginalis G3]KAI5521363.1 acetylation-dependent protein binding [Trichomonas vaginalis G3]|eukprot:XP_001309895.1 Bromodomain containing protein [Trichomonas vaginalis G3]
MKEELHKCLTDILEKLMSHPATRTFHTPVPTGEEAPANYFEIIKNPIDLGTIKQKLEENKYEGFKDFHTDVELVWKNAETYNEPGTTVSILAAEGRKVFAALCRKENMFLLCTWCNEAYRLKKKLSEVIQSAPNKIKQYINNQSNQKQNKQNNTLFTETEMVNFVKASKMLPSEDCQRDMLKIINEHQPEIDTGLETLDVDITNFSLPTMHALQDYMRSTLEHAGLKYPE